MEEDMAPLCLDMGTEGSDYYKKASIRWPCPEIERETTHRDGKTLLWLLFCNIKATNNYYSFWITKTRCKNDDS